MCKFFNIYINDRKTKYVGKVSRDDSSTFPSATLVLKADSMIANIGGGIYRRREGSL